MVKGHMQATMTGLAFKQADKIIFMNPFPVTLLLLTVFIYLPWKSFIFPSHQENL